MNERLPISLLANLLFSIFRTNFELPAQRHSRIHISLLLLLSYLIASENDPQQQQRNTLSSQQYHSSIAPNKALLYHIMNRPEASTPFHFPLQSPKPPSLTFNPP